jgi:hypothetical protein
MGRNLPGPILGAMSTLPVSVRLAAGLLAAQALAVTAITVYLVYAELAYRSDTNGDTKSLGWAVVGFAAIGALLLGLLTWGVARLKRWARDLAVATQLILLAPAYYMITSELPWLGVIVGAIAIAIVAFSVLPATNKALGVSA